MTDQIDWNAWEGSRYVKIKVGKPKTLTVDSVRETTTQIKDKDKSGSDITKDVRCLVFHVTKEDGEAVDKEFSVTSRLLAQKLKPFVQKGMPFTVTIHSSGEKFEREYEVQAA